MSVARWAYAVCAMLVLLACTMASADPKPRIFCKNVEYTGPVLMVDSQPYVQADRFAAAMGWATAKQDGAVCIAPTHDQCQLVTGASGLFVGSKPFTGHTQVNDNDLYVSLNDLTTFLGGSVTPVPQYNSVKLDIPNMPTAAAVANAPVAVGERIKATPYTIVEFYATW